MLALACFAPLQYVLQLTELPIFVQFVVVDCCLMIIGAGGAGGGVYCWPTNLKSGNFPSEAPQENVITYQVTGPGKTSATSPPAWLSLATTL